VTGTRIRVAIVDDHPALRDGTAVLLEREGLDVIASAGTLAEARTLLSGEARPDVLVLDIRLAEERGLELLQAGGGASDRPAIVVWTGFDIPQYASYALRAGAAGFVLKTAPLSELVEAIRVAAAGGVRFSHMPAAEGLGLTPREREVVAYVVAGLGNDEIAGRLGVSARAVEGHLTRLYERHDLRSRAELVARAVQHGWLDLPMELPTR
jgi:DNA-binding NarL/FixJ family response regulator